MVRRPSHSPAEEEGFVLSRKLKPRLWQTTDVNRACCQYFFSARAAFAGARMVHIGVDAAFVGGLHRMLGYFTLPFGSGCWAAPTDQFGSIAVSSAHKLLCRSDRFTKVYVDAFFPPNRCLLSLRHINFCVFRCVHECFSLQVPGSTFHVMKNGNTCTSSVI